MMFIGNYIQFRQLFGAIAVIALLGACATMQRDQATMDYSDAVYNTLLAEFSLRDNEQDKAADYFAAAYSKLPQAGFMLRVIETALESGQHIVAMRVSEDLLRLRPQHSLVQRLLPYLYLNHGQAERAIQLLRTQHDETVQNEVFLKVAAVGLFNENEQNLEGLRKVAESFPHNAFAQFAYASSAGRAQRYEDVITFATQGIARKPELDTGYRLKALALRKLERTSEAYLVLKQGLEEVPTSQILRWEMAGILRQLENYSASYDEYLKIYEATLEPPFELLQEMGLLLLQMDDVDHAIHYFRLLNEYPGLRIRANYLLAHAWYQKENYIRAIELLNGITTDTPYYEKAQLLITRMYRKQGQVNAALKQLRDAVNALGDGSEDIKVNFYIAQGEILQEEKRYEDVYKLYSTAIQLFPEQTVFRSLRAYNASLMDDVATLEQDVHFLLQLDPDDADALNLIGYYFADENIRLAEAKQYLDRAYALAPTDPRIIDSVAWLEFRLGNFERAEQLVRQALALYQDPEIYGHLVEILRARKRFAEANKHLREALGMYPDDHYLKSL